jgi:3-hydroxymyristoyl/3-hydroxydecanoyl-(acyl carrier protein) dehydratase
LVTSYEEKDLADIFLPVGQMLQVHKIGHVSDGKIVGERRISEEDWFFPLHFPSDPIFPGSLLIEGAGQVVAHFSGNYPVPIQIITRVKNDQCLVCHPETRNLIDKTIEAKHSLHMDRMPQQARS